MKEKLDDWKARFNDIKDKDMPKITETINEIEELFLEKNFKEEEYSNRLNKLKLKYFLICIDM